MSDHKMTPEQIDNWRKALSMTLGPYALLMPEEQIQALRNKFQNEVDEMENIDNKSTGATMISDKIIKPKT